MLGRVEIPENLNIGTNLPDCLKSELVEFLRQNLDVFAWSLIDIQRVEHQVTIMHDLNVDPNARLKRKKERNQAPKASHSVRRDQSNTTYQINEVLYPIWMANLVFSQKTNKKWRMCLDLMDLSKCCLKHSFPMSSTTSW